MRLVFDLTVSTSAPFQVRTMLAALAADLDPKTLGLRIVVSEMVSNAVKWAATAVTGCACSTASPPRGAPRGGTDVWFELGG